MSNLDQLFINTTYGISIIPSYPNTYTVRWSQGSGKVTGGAMPDRFAPDTMTPNSLLSSYVAATQAIPANAPLLMAFIESGILPVPFDCTVFVQLT